MRARNTWLLFPLPRIIGKRRKECLIRTADERVGYPFVYDVSVVSMALVNEAGEMYAVATTERMTGTK